MNTKYFLYAVALTIVTTVINWSNAISHMSGTGSGSSYRSSSGYSGGSWGGGGHK